MLPNRVSNPGPLTYESGALPIALCGPAKFMVRDDKNDTHRLFVQMHKGYLLIYLMLMRH